MNKILATFLLLVLIIPKLYATLDDEQINILSEKVRVAQEQFPEGDYKDIHYVKNILQKMYSLDREIRDEILKDMNNPRVHELLILMDQFHTLQMKKILGEHGWVTISTFGEEADHQAWLLVQHADSDPFFQAACAFILSHLWDKKETNPGNYAYLYDRAVLKFSCLGLQQKYGTQADTEGNRIVLFPYEGTLQDLEERRQQIGLETTEHYLKKMKELYHPQPLTSNP